MGKKHLLYIHHEQFAKETEKSKLVNDLLNDHYSGKEPVVYKAVYDIETKNPKPIITKRNEDMKFCKHNAVKGFCKKGCK